MYYNVSDKSILDQAIDDVEFFEEYPEVCELL